MCPKIYFFILNKFSIVADDVSAMKTPSPLSNIGAEYFANSSPGFDCVFKTRLSDFVVNEITETGEVCELTELEPIVDRELEARERESFVNALTATKDNKDVVREEVFEEFARICAKEEDVVRLRKFLSAPGVLRGVVHDEKKDNEQRDDDLGVAPLVLAPSRDKEYRTGLHVFFRQFQLETDTVVSSHDEHERCVRIHPASERCNNMETKEADQKQMSTSKGRKRRKINNNNNDGGNTRTFPRRLHWPAGIPTFLEFTLCKSGRDTTDALKALGMLLNCNPKKFQIAGAKDKRGVTTQRVTVSKYRATKLAELNKKLRDAKIGNFKYVERPLYLGKSQGNAFTICLRNIDENDNDIVVQAFKTLRESGTINYFGEQRFGNVSSFSTNVAEKDEGKTEPEVSSSSVGTTHRIGASLLKGEFKRAIDIILQPRRNNSESQKVRCPKERYLENEDAHEALKTFPRSMHIERAILEVKAKKGRETDFSGQLLAIPTKIRSMYIHAYQSYLWNKVASERVRAFGINTVVEGDLVTIKDTSGKTAEEIQKFSDEAYDKGLKSQNVKLVSAEDVANNTYEPPDVVLPIPGHSIAYPSWTIEINDKENENEKQVSARELFYLLAKEEDGVDLDTPAHSVMEFSIKSFPGDYRPLFLHAKDLQFELMRYTEANSDLIKTVLDAVITEKTPYMKNANNDDVNLLGSKEDKLAAKLSFKLGTGSYATMILREITKGGAKEHRYLR